MINTGLVNWRLVFWASSLDGGILICVKNDPLNGVNKKSLESLWWNWEGKVKSNNKGIGSGEVN